MSEIPLLTLHTSDGIDKAVSDLYLCHGCLHLKFLANTGLRHSLVFVDLEDANYTIYMAHG